MTFQFTNSEKENESKIYPQTLGTDIGEQEPGMVESMYIT